MVNLRCFRRNLALLLVIATCFVSVSLSAQTFVKPGPDNTGHTTPLSSLKVYDGPSKIIEDGTVIEGVKLDGQITIFANNVVIRDFFLETEGFYGIQVKEGTGILIEDGIIEGMKSAAILGSNFTARRLEIRNSGGDGLKPTSNFLIEGNWLHSLGYLESAHADGLQMVTGNNGIVRGNNFDMPHGIPGFKNSQCFILSTNVGSISDILIEENWINGGGFSVIIGDKGVGHGDPKNIRVVNNRFGTDYQFGLFKLEGDVVTSGNVWESSGLLVPNQSNEDPSELEDPIATPVPETTGAPEINSSSFYSLVPQTVSISSDDPNAMIFYTLDGTRPTEESQVYERPLILNDSAVLQAVSKVDNGELSDIAAEGFYFVPFPTSDDWANLSLPVMDSSFSASVEFVPNGQETDSVIGFSLGGAEQYTDLAIIVRFAPTGIIDARNGAVYEAAGIVNYESGETYLINIDVNMDSNTYSASVTAGAGSSVLIASNYKFRIEQSAVNSIDNLSFTSVGSTGMVKTVGFDKSPSAPTNFSRQ